MADKEWQNAARAAWTRVPIRNPVEPGPAMADKEWQNAARAAWTKVPIWNPVEPGSAPLQRDSLLAEVVRGVKNVPPMPLVAGGPYAAGAALGLHIANKMAESGGELPPAPKSAAGVVLPPNPAMRAAGAASAGSRQEPRSELMKVLDSLYKANPKGGITLGQLQALGSVFPGTAPASGRGGRAMSAADVAGLQLLAEADEQLNMDYAKAVNQPTQELANQEYTKAIDRRKALREMLATKTQLDDAALAERLGLGAVAE